MKTYTNCVLRFLQPMTKLQRKQKFMSPIIFYLLTLIVLARQLCSFRRSWLPFLVVSWYFRPFMLINCLEFHIQIQAAVLALRNIRGLPRPKDYVKRKDEDILDWLQDMFGFQVTVLLVILFFCWYALFGLLEVKMICFDSDVDGGTLRKITWPIKGNT